MSNQLPPMVRTFMTHDMPDIDIASLATGRSREFGRIMDAIARSRAAAPGPLQHVVLYGSRGFGKSFMTRKVEIAAAQLDGTLGPVHYLLLPEEQHNLQRNPHEFLDFVAKRLQEKREKAGSADAAFKTTMFQWPQPGEEGRRWDEAVARLETEIDATLDGRPGLIIVVVENFDTLLATLFKADEDEQRLRQWLDRPNNRLMLFATATGTVDILYDRPLFHAFESVRLTPWSPSECVDYFNRWRAREGRPPLSSAEIAKAHAIAEFIGGTPRLAQLLAKVIDTGEALTVAETMSELVDHLAEYYRRRIEDLPPLARGLLDALIRGGEPASQTELAERVGAGGQNIIARTMADLERADIIRGLKARSGRRKLYSVTDRVFAHYYRLRQGSTVARQTPLLTILDFLRSFYSRDEKLKRVFSYLAAGQPAEANLFGQLVREGTERQANAFQNRFMSRLRLYQAGLTEAQGNELRAIATMLADEPAQAHNQCDDFQADTSIAEAICTAVQAQAIHRLTGSDDDTRRQLQAALAAQDDDAAALLACELAQLDETRPELAAIAFEPLRDLAAIGEPGVRVTATLLAARRAHRMGAFDEAIDLAAAIEAIVRDEKWTSAELDMLKVLADAHMELKNYEAVFAACDRACDLASEIGDDSICFAKFSQNAMARLNGDDFEGALHWARRALALNPETSSAQRHMNAALLALVGHGARFDKDIEKADQLFAEAISLFESFGAMNVLPDIMRYRIDVLLDLERFQEAFDLAERAIALFSNDTSDQARCHVLRKAMQAGNKLDRSDDVIAMGDQAIALAQSLDRRSDEIAVRMLLAGAWAEKGDLATSWDMTLMTLALARVQSNPGYLVPVLLASSMVGLLDGRREAIDYFLEGLTITQASADQDLAREIIHLGTFFIGCARCDAFDTLDRTLADHGDWLIENIQAFVFERMSGGQLARHGQLHGRAAGYAAFAGLLPRAASFMARMPQEKRDGTWLLDLVAGFAEQCRDVGLLRDVARLLTDDLAHDSFAVREALLALASYDEADQPEQFLSSLDPDLATLVRRFRRMDDPDEDEDG